MLVGPAGVRALVAGDNSAELRLEFLPNGAQIYPGDEVYTSGSDGVLPRGLRVGVVEGTPGSWKAIPFAQPGDVEFVSVLFFDTPALSTTDPGAARATSARALSSEPQGVSGVARLSPGPVSAPPAAEVQPVGILIKHAGADNRSAVPREASDPQ